MELRGIPLAILALIACPALASGQTALSLSTDGSCYGLGDSVTVTVELAGAPANIVSGDLFLTFDDARLTFVSMDPGSPWTDEDAETVAAGTIAYSLSIPDAGTGATSGTMATIVFTAASEVCDVAALVAFDTPHVPPNELTDESAGTYSPDQANLSLSDADSISIDDTDPVFDTFPADASVECGDDTSPAATGTPTGSDDCSAVTVDFADTPSAGCGLTATITRTWTLTDDCGNVASQDQIITVTDTTDPLFGTFPADAALSCGDDTAPAATGTPTGSDTCGAVSIDFQDATSPACGDTITRTWTVTDDCGNSASQDQIITLADTTNPVFDTFPADAAIECGGDTSPAATGTPTGSDDCSSVTIDFADAPLAGCGLTATITRTWTLTDGCGNVASQDQIITVADTTNPVFDTFPADASVECGDDTSPAGTGTPTGSDACGAVTVDFTDAAESGCGSTSTITRTWTVTDDCGNVASQDQIITVADTTDPVFDTFPADTALSCGDDSSPAATGTPTGSDTCGAASVDFADVTESACGDTITRTWTVTDDCGNSVSQEQIITLADTTSPVFDTFPADAAVECGDDTSPAATGTPTGSDDCSSVTVDFADATVAGCGASGTITRTWTITDGCGNSAAQDQTITVADTTDPVFDDFPADMILQCGDDTSPANTGTPVAADACGGVTIDFNEILVPGCGEFVSVVRTWIATDDCGNTRSAAQNIVVVDTTDPVFDGFPADVTVGCFDDTSPATTGTPLASDTCGEVTLDFSDAVTPDCGGSETVTRTWSVTDQCGNQTLQDQVIAVVDMDDPTFLSFPADVALECGDDTAPEATGLPTGVDACSGVTFGMTDLLEFGCGSSGTITRTWSIVDECGNTVAQAQIITLTDTTAPQFTRFPAGATVECGDDTSPAATGTPVAEDACGAPELTFGDESVAGCGTTAVITRTWTATDGCGQQTSQAQVITVSDTTAPVVTPPDDLVLMSAAGGCAASISPGDLGAATVEDACAGGGLAATATRGDGLPLDDPYPPGDTAITWSATDECGHEGSAVQIVTVDPINALLVDVAIQPVVEPGPLVRCITFELFDCGSGDSAEVSADLLFIDGVAQGAVVDVPCGTWTCISARDPFHSLRRTDLDGFGVAGDVYVADFTGFGPDTDVLTGGNLNGDDVVDVLDFGVFALQFGEIVPLDSDCLLPPPHADVSGDGAVRVEDFTFIQINFFEFDEAGCCGLAEAPAGVASISTGALAERGLAPLVAGDLNLDGMLDTADLVAFMHGARPRPAGMSAASVLDGPWSDRAVWSGGAVPGGMTGDAIDVAIVTAVTVEAAGAAAGAIEIGPVGLLVVDRGTLEAETIRVRSGGELIVGGGAVSVGDLTVEVGATLRVERAGRLEAGTLTVEPGAVLLWSAGSITVGGAALVLETVAAPGPGGEVRP